MELGIASGVEGSFTDSQPGSVGIGLGARDMECEEFLRDYSDFFDRQFEEHCIVSYCDHLLKCADCAEGDRVVRRVRELFRGLERSRTPGK
jgi:hypothetical protein